MENDKVIEILDNCISSDYPCINCQIASMPIYDGGTSCTHNLMIAALTVLKEQKKEIDKLSKIIEL